MATWLDAASRYLIDTAIIGAVFSLACVLAMVLCRQPAQRCLLARGSLFGLLLTPLLPALWVQPSLVVPEFLFPSTLRPLSVVFDWLESLRYSLTGLLAFGVLEVRPPRASWIRPSGLRNETFFNPLACGVRLD